MRQIIGFHFTLKDQFSNVLGSSRDNAGHPMLVLQGSGSILAALERHVSDMSVGESKSVVIPAGEAYGEVDPSLKMKIAHSKFPEGTDVVVGLKFQGGEREGWPIIFRVTEINGEEVYVDANHELAGLSLHYDVEITEKREATAEEIAHGHAHHHGGSCD
ncbi:MAG: peptidylprolyl isomerase [Maricaulaceae bacterium]